MFLGPGIAILNRRIALPDFARATPRLSIPLPDPGSVHSRSNIAIPGSSSVLSCPGITMPHLSCPFRKSSSTLPAAGIKFVFFQMRHLRSPVEATCVVNAIRTAASTGVARHVFSVCVMREPESARGRLGQVDEEIEGYERIALWSVTNLSQPRALHDADAEPYQRSHLCTIGNRSARVAF